MPNWCTNAIKISGKAEKVNSLAKKINSLTESEKLLFESLLPEVKLPENEEEHRDFMVNTYGCKWDIPFKEVVFSEYGSAEYYLTFDSPWSAPLGFCGLIAKTYAVDVYIVFGDDGEDFYGNASYDSEGKELFYNEYPYKEGMYKIDREAFWENAAYYMEDFCANELSFDEIMEEFSFVEEADKEKLIEIYTDVSDNF